MYNAFIIAIGMPSPASWILIVLAILLLFGGKKIPELMKGLGKGMKEFKDATKEGETEEKKSEDS